MRWIDRNVVEGGFFGLLFAAIPAWFVVDSMHRLETAVQQQQKILEEQQKTLEEIKRELSEIRAKQR
ncbi:MAG: hypothetical protein L0241_05650 [Planctomycetia bacterium]|nr:hypothetical protein [Planctomycetia bacterium]